MDEPRQYSWEVQYLTPATYDDGSAMLSSAMLINHGSVVATDVGSAALKARAGLERISKTGQPGRRAFTIIKLERGEEFIG